MIAVGRRPGQSTTFALQTVGFIGPTQYPRMKPNESAKQGLQFPLHFASALREIRRQRLAASGLSLTIASIAAWTPLNAIFLLSGPGPVKLLIMRSYSSSDKGLGSVIACSRRIYRRFGNEARRNRFVLLFGRFTHQSQTLGHTRHTIPPTARTHLLTHIPVSHIGQSALHRMCFEQMLYQSWRHGPQPRRDLIGHCPRERPACHAQGRHAGG